MAHENTMHCGLGHEFSDTAAHKDHHGWWCPDCGNTAHTGPRPSAHRYWYSVHLPEIGLTHQSGWCFGADSLAAAAAAIREITERDPKRGAFVLVSDVHVTHDTACSCIPADQRWY